MVIERAFGMLKGRLRWLRFIEMDSLDNIAKVIIVACTLHNVCLMQEDELDEIFDEEEEVNDWQDTGLRKANACLKRDTIKNMLVEL